MDRKDFAKLSVENPIVTDSSTRFSNRGHIIASVGAAIGIANLVLFPARVFNYGGMAFILIFVLCTIIMGVPLMIAEKALGKSGQSDAVTAYAKIGGKKWGLAGVIGMITTTVILSFYMVIAGWALYYLYTYIFDYSAITDAASSARSSGEASIAGIGGLFGVFVTSVHKVILFAGLFVGLTVFIVANDINKGIEWFSSKFVPLLVVLVLLLIFVIPIVAGDKINYSNFDFDFAALFRIDQSGRIGIIEAVGQAFFSLSLGACGMITYGSHIHRKTNVVTNSHLIVHIDTIVAILAAVLIIPLFDPDGSVGLDPSLVFITLVDTFQGFGEPWGRLVGLSFFLLFNFAIITSTISLLEPVVVYFAKNRTYDRKHYAILFGFIVFLLSIPAILSFSPHVPGMLTDFLGYGNKSDGTMGYFNFVLDFFGTFALLVGSFILAIFIRYKWSLEGLIEEIKLGAPAPSPMLRKFLSISLLWVVPILMFCLFLGECFKVMHKMGWVG